MSDCARSRKTKRKYRKQGKSVKWLKSIVKGGRNRLHQCCSYNPLGLKRSPQTRACANSAPSICPEINNQIAEQPNLKQDLASQISMQSIRIKCILYTVQKANMPNYVISHMLLAESLVSFEMFNKKYQKPNNSITCIQPL